MRTSFIIGSVTLALCGCGGNKTTGTGGSSSSTTTTGSTMTTGTMTTGTMTTTGTAMTTTGTKMTTTGSTMTTTGSTMTSSSTGTAGGTWTAIDLPMETIAGGTMVDHAMYDWITDIRFTSATNGLISTYSTNPASDEGGGVFLVNGATITVVASGTTLGGGVGAGASFFGIYGTGQNLVSPMDQIENIVTSTNGGTSFAKVANGNGLYNSGLQPALFLAPTSAGWWAADNFQVYKSATAPGASATWTNVTPDPTVCDSPTTTNGDPRGGGAEPRGGMDMMVSADGMHVVYPASGLAVCVTSDGGTTWNKVSMPNPPASVPTGRDVYAITDTAGIFFGADDGGSPAVVYYTADAGQTWTAATTPTQGPTAVFGLHGAFFAPDHTTGWIIGSQSGDSASTPPLLWKTTDGGHTWKDISTTSFTGSAIDPSGAEPLVTGFALDANNIWIGGHHGTFYHNGVGG